MSPALLTFERGETTADELNVKDEDLLDVVCMEPVLASGLFGLVNLGETFLLAFFRWISEIENGVRIIKKVPCSVVTLRRSAAPKGSAWDLCLRAQPVRSDSAARLSSIN